MLNILQGSIVDLQFASFSNIIDEIIRIKQETGTLKKLFKYAAVLGFSFLISAVLSNMVNCLRAKFRLELDMQLDLYKID